MGTRRLVDGYVQYLKNLVIAFRAVLHMLGRTLQRADKLVWALLGGHPDATISWGVGHWVLTRRSLGKILGPVVDLVARLWDGPSHALRTRLHHGVQPPAGAGIHNTIITLFIVLTILSFTCGSIT
jgi:hypothetical protein